ncbi:hypothetical protein SARC_16682, partial [Sphaeroforma arctica JP610]
MNVKIESVLAATQTPSTLPQILSGSPPDVAQNEMLDIFGFDQFDLIQEIFTNREKIVTAVFKQLEIIKAETQEENEALVAEKDNANKQFGAQVTVTTQGAKARSKQIRKQQIKEM